MQSSSSGTTGWEGQDSARHSSPLIHDGSSRTRADAKRDGHSEPRSLEACPCSMSKG